MARIGLLSLGALLLLCFTQRTEGGGHIEIDMKRFQSSCSDNLGSQPCDTYFYLCIDKPGPWDFNCHYRKYGPSSVYENTNNMEFGGNVGGITNPMVVSASRFDSNQVMFVVQAHDDEFWQSDEHLVTVGKTVMFTPALGKENARWTSSYMSQSHYHVWFAYRAYCDAYYYTSACDKYCRARDDSQGHYTCDPNTGDKICMRGWKGANCNEDINECVNSTGPCLQNAACTNSPGSYTCDCPNGYTGQNCNEVDSLCHSSPCQHGGTCSGDMQNYTCACTFEWEGANCETQVDFCVSNPCQNNGTCFGSVGNYTCVCAPGWNGTHCQTEVNACDSAPCTNGASCTKLPSAQYECACTAAYEGKNCDALKNPCEPNPCKNSGNCSAVDYDRFNCSCVYGWDDATCSSYIVVDNEQQTGQAEGKGVNWVPIVIAFVSALVIVLGVIALLYIRRRRRQNKELDALRTDAEQQQQHVVQPVAGRDNLAFRNALYDNQANSMRDQQANGRSTMPVPPTPTQTAEQQFRDEWFYPTKPGKLPEDEGAVGGANPYNDIDGGYMTPVKRVEGAVGGVAAREKDTKQKTAASGGLLDTRTMAGETVGNDYADFGELKRRSMAARASQDLSDLDTTAVKGQGEENHYQELDDVILDIQKDPHGAVHFTPTPTPTPTDAGSSHYDTVPTRHHLSPPEATPGAGYMSMNEGRSSQSQAEETLEPLDLTDDDDDDDEEEAVHQEDLNKLRQEVLQRSASNHNA